MIYEITPLEFAQIDCDESILFIDGDKEKKRRIGCFAWLLQNGLENILIDTGIDDIKAVNHTKKGSGWWERGINGKPLKQNLKALGIESNSISKVILTHAHYDHISGLPCLENAEIYMCDDEYTDFIDVNNPFFDMLAPSRKFLLEQKSKGKLILFQEQMKINKYIYVVKVGGHTRGSAIVFLILDNSEYIFTGDAVFLNENISENRPIGLTQNHMQSMRVLDLCKKTNGLCLTSHDLDCLDGF